MAQKMIITLDPGHGHNHNKGAVSPYYEGNIMFNLAIELKKELELTNIFTVFLTRNSIEQNPSIEERGKMSIINKSDIFISLHSNAPGANTNPDNVYGVVSFYSLNNPLKNVELIKQLNTAIVSTFKNGVPKSYDRGVTIHKHPSYPNLDYFGVIRASVGSGSNVKYSYLIEHGFHTNKEECAWLNNPNNISKLAKAEANVLYNYFKNKVDSIPTTPSTKVESYEVYNEINRYNDSTSAIKNTNALTIKLKPGVYYVFKKAPNGSINLTTDKMAIISGAWINPNDNKKPIIESPSIPIEEYVVVTKINGYSSADNAMKCINSVASVPVGIYYIYKKWNNGSINITTDKTAKTSKYWINPNENIIINKPPAEIPIDTSGLHSISFTPDSFPEITANQAILYIKKNNPLYKLNCSIEELIYYFIMAGHDENIRWDIAFCQAVVETGLFKYGNQTKWDQNNYAGLGTDSTAPLIATFISPYEGALAQIQHLKAYANKKELYIVCVDPRFKYVTRGCSPFVEWLGADDNPNNNTNDKLGWAAGKGYGASIIKILNEIKKI